MTARRFLARLALATVATLAVTGAPVLAAGAPPAAALGAPAIVGMAADAGPSATLVEPEPGSASERPSPVFTVATGRGVRVELRVDGRTIGEKQIGRTTVDTRTGETRRSYYGVVLAEGPNAVELIPIAPDGTRGTPVELVVYGPGVPAALHVAIDGALVANGRSPGTVTVAATDRYGHPALPGTILRLAVVRGDARFGTLAAPAAATAPAAETLPGGTAGGASLLAQPGTLAGAPTDAGLPLAAGTVAGPTNAAGYAAPTTGLPSNARAVAATDTQSPTIDVALEPGGIARIPLVPGLTSGAIVLRATYADLVADANGFVLPAIRRPLVVGLATAGVGAVPGVPGEDPGAPNGANSRLGRIALFGTGGIGPHALATVAYDTADVLDRTDRYGAFADDPLARPYQTYGDASLRRDDALSRDHLYARIADGRSSFTWGEFQARTGVDGGIGGFDQLLSGANLELANKRAAVQAFHARNEIAFARQVIAPTGLASLATTLRPGILVGTDVVSLVALDRRTGAILSQSVLARNVDYVIDYDAGVLRFLNPPLPYDASFDPQQILVQYQYEGPQADSETTGGRAEIIVDPRTRTRAAVGYVDEASGAGNFALASQDLTGTTPGGTWSLGHIHASGADVGGAIGTTGIGAGSALATGATLAAPTAVVGGDAYQATLSTTVGTGRATAGFAATTPGFDNPFGGLATPGLLSYRAGYELGLGASKTTTLAFSFDHEQNDVPGTHAVQSDVTARARRPVTRRVTLVGGLALRSLGGGSTAATATSATAATNAASEQVASGGLAQAQLGFEWRVAPHVELDAQRQENLGGVRDPYAPAATTAQLAYATGPRGRVYLRQLWADAPTQSFATATSALTGLAGATRSTVLGVEQTVGSGTTVSDEYGVDRTGNGGDVYSALGVRQAFALGKDLKGGLTFQNANAVGAASGTPAGFQLYGVQLAYGTRSIRATADVQQRNGNAAGFSLAAGAAGALSRDVSLIGSIASSSVAGFHLVDDRVSLAVRPAANDRSVTLFGFEAKNGDLASTGAKTELLSLEQLVRPIRAVELAARVAYKLDGDAYYTAGTSLYGLRVDGRVTRRFDLAAEGRLLEIRDAAGAATRALAIEAGERLGDALRFAVGYNVSGSPDAALAAAPARRGFYATFTSTIDRIGGWGREGR